MPWSCFPVFQCLCVNIPKLHFLIVKFIRFRPMTGMIRKLWKMAVETGFLLRWMHFIYSYSTFSTLDYISCKIIRTTRTHSIVGRNSLKWGRQDVIPLFYGRVLQMVLCGSTDEDCGRGLWSTMQMLRPIWAKLIVWQCTEQGNPWDRGSIECLYLLQAFPKKPVTKHKAWFNISGLACTMGATLLVSTLL